MLRFDTLEVGDRFSNSYHTQTHVGVKIQQHADANPMNAAYRSYKMEWKKKVHILTGERNSSCVNAFPISKVRDSFPEMQI